MQTVLLSLHIFLDSLLPCCGCKTFHTDAKAAACSSVYFVLSPTLASNSQNTAEPLMLVGAMRNECDVAYELSRTAKPIYSGDGARAVLRARIICGTRPAVYSLLKSFKAHITFLADLG